MDYIVGDGGAGPYVRKKLRTSAKILASKQPALWESPERSMGLGMQGGEIVAADEGIGAWQVTFGTVRARRRAPAILSAGLPVIERRVCDGAFGNSVVRGFWCLVDCGL